MVRSLLTGPGLAKWDAGEGPDGLPPIGIGPESCALCSSKWTLEGDKINQKHMLRFDPRVFSRLVKSLKTSQNQFCLL